MPGVPAGVTAATLDPRGREAFDLVGSNQNAKLRQSVTFVIHRPEGRQDSITTTSRLDTPPELNYAWHKGIMPYMLEELIA